jgi:hypothetical protein
MRKFMFCSQAKEEAESDSTEQGGHTFRKQRPINSISQGKEVMMLQTPTQSSSSGPARCFLALCVFSVAMG